MWAPLHGGLRSPVPSGTASLLVRTENESGDTTFGALIHTHDGGRLEPGSSLDVTIHFWSDPPPAAVGIGRRFFVWHLRDVGTGTFITAPRTGPAPRPSPTPPRTSRG